MRGLSDTVTDTMSAAESTHCLVLTHRVLESARTVRGLDAVCVFVTNRSFGASAISAAQRLRRISKRCHTTLAYHTHMHLRISVFLEEVSLIWGKLRCRLRASHMLLQSTRTDSWMLWLSRHASKNNKTNRSPTPPQPQRSLFFHQHFAARMAFNKFSRIPHMSHFVCYGVTGHPPDAIVQHVQVLGEVRGSRANDASSGTFCRVEDVGVHNLSGVDDALRAAARERASLTEQLAKQNREAREAKREREALKREAREAKRGAARERARVDSVSKRLACVSRSQVAMLVRNAVLGTVFLIAARSNMWPSSLANLPSKMFLDRIPPQLRDLPGFQRHFRAATRYACGRYSSRNGYVHPETWRQFVSRILPDIVKARDLPEWKSNEEGLQDIIKCLDSTADCAEAMATAEEHRT